MTAKAASQKKRARCDTPTKVVLSLFTVPMITLFVAIPMACSSSSSSSRYATGSSTSAAAILTTVEEVQSEDTLPTAISVPALEWLTSFKPSVEAFDALLREAEILDEHWYAKSLREATECVYRLETDFGGGSGTVIACVPILVLEEPTENGQRDNHTPWKLDPNEPDSQSPELPSVRVRIKYLVFLLTAKHVVEQEIEIIVPKPLPEPLPEAQPQAPEENKPEEGNPENTPEEAPKVLEFEVVTKILRTQQARAFNATNVLRSDVVIYCPSDSDSTDSTDAALVVFTTDEAVPFARINTEYPEIADSVFKVGFGGPSRRFWISQGLVCDPEEARATTPITFGDSGGAVFDTEGRLLGVPVGVEVTDFYGHPSVIEAHCWYEPLPKLWQWIGATFMYQTLSSLEEILVLSESLEGRLELISNE